jgi:hypothetical protein
LVLAIGKRHRDVAIGAPVQLRGPARARAGSTAHPRIEGVEQAVAFEPVEVELRLVWREPEAIRGEFPAHRSRLCAHEQVEAAPKRVGQGTDACDVSVGEGHTGPF